MKLKCKYVRQGMDMQGDRELTFSIPLYQTRHIEELSTEKNYRIELKEIKSQRSIQQNKFLWSLLHELETKTQEDTWEWYCKALMEAKSKYEYILALPDTKEALKRTFRAIQLTGIRQVETENGLVEMEMYRVFEGSSKFSTKEMNQLLDIVIGWCNELGIDTDIYNYE